MNGILMNRMRKASLLLFAIIATAPLLLGAEYRSVMLSDSTVISFNFRQGDDLLLRDYRNNAQALDVMMRLMAPENITHISKITIIGSASPEGRVETNIQLAQRRAESVRGYIRWRWGGMLKDDVVQITRQTNYLPAWIRAVEADAAVPRRNRVLEILRSDASILTKWANIQLLAGGAAEYMERRLFPLLRSTVSCIITLKTPVELPVELSAGLPLTPDTTQTVTPGDEAVTQRTKEVAPTLEPSHEPVVTPLLPTTYKPLFALKTNLLFDVASLLNLEVEIPLGKRFSLAVEATFPWWLWEDKQHCLQMKNVNLEGRYWFGNRSNPRHRLTGWFAGVYANGGDYDLEWERKGYQGEYFWASGISAGYAHAINKRGNLRMEYSLGVGYLKTRYRHYEAVMESDQQWHLYRRNNGQFEWIGPTRAKISLVWMLGISRKGGRK